MKNAKPTWPESRIGAELLVSLLKELEDCVEEEVVLCVLCCLQKFARGNHVHNANTSNKPKGENDL